jgi:nicotinate dehydrogenase subunit A
MSTIAMRVNGAAHTVDVDPATPLLYVLSDDLALRGPKFGCGLGQCGACAVIVRGRAVRSCVTPVGTLNGAEVTTLEGLGTVERPHPIQQAFIDEQAAQCGYCASGMIIAAADLLKRNPQPTEAEVRSALAGNLCRCGSHNRIIRAVMRVTQANGRT